MKLLFVHDHYFYKDKDGVYFSAGGFPWYLWEKYLNHFETITVVGRYGGELENNQKLVKSSHDRVRFAFVDKISSLKGILKINKVKNEISLLLKDADALVARLPSENGIIASELAKKSGKYYALEVVGCAWDALWNYGGLKSKLYAPILYKRMQDSVFKAPQVLYVTSEFLQKRYKHAPNAFVLNASNVDISDFENYIIKKRKQKIDNLDIKNKKIKIGLIGNYKAKYKGLHIAIKAIGYLKKHKNFDNFEFHVLGKGNPLEYKELIRKYNCSKKIFFDGTLPNGRPVLEWIDKQDFYIQPSLTEGLPRSVIEAMSRGSIIVGTKTGGIPELLGNNFVVKSGNPNHLARKMWEVIQYPKEQLKAIATSNFKTAQKYDSKRLADIRFRFYENLKNQVKNKGNESN